MPSTNRPLFLKREGQPCVLWRSVFRATLLSPFTSERRLEPLGIVYNVADHQPTQALSVEGNSSNMESSDISSASLPTDSTQDGQTDDGSDQGSVTSDLST